MNVICPECRSVFRVDPAKVPSASVRARCSVCGGVILIAGEAGAASDFGASERATRDSVGIVRESTSTTAVSASEDRPASHELTTPPGAVDTSPVMRTAEPPLPDEPEPRITADEDAERTAQETTAPQVTSAPDAPPVAVARPDQEARGSERATPPAGEARFFSPASAAPPAPRPQTPSRPMIPFFAARNAPGTPADGSPVGTAATRPNMPFARPPAPPRPPAGSPPSASPSTPVSPSASFPPRPEEARRVTPVSPAATVPAAAHVEPVVRGTPAGNAAPAAAGMATPTARPPINPFLANDPNAKAKRLARALVSDIVAYFPQKREEGLRDGTLKQLFREEIKKSYEEYIDQIGREFAEGTTHFQDALNDVLAGGKKLF